VVPARTIMDLRSPIHFVLEPGAYVARECDPRLPDF
jgi:hypothetical protein